MCVYVSMWFDKHVCMIVCESLIDNRDFSVPQDKIFKMFSK